MSTSRAPNQPPEQILVKPTFGDYYRFSSVGHSTPEPDVLVVKSPVSIVCKDFCFMLCFLWGFVIA